VAVLVDGTYVTDADGNRTYTARSETELDQIAALVRSAIGVDAARGDSLEVVNMPFAEIDTYEALPDNTLFGFDKNKLLDVAKFITVAIMIILVILLVLQPMVGRLLANEGAEKPEEEDHDLLGSRPMSPALEGPNTSAYNPEGLEEDEEEEDVN